MVYMKYKLFPYMCIYTIYIHTPACGRWALSNFISAYNAPAWAYHTVDTASTVAYTLPAPAPVIVNQLGFEITTVSLLQYRDREQHYAMMLTYVNIHGMVSNLRPVCRCHAKYANTPMYSPGLFVRRWCRTYCLGIRKTTRSRTQ